MTGDARVRAFARYDGVVRDSIHCLKYRGKIQLARPLGFLLYSAFFQNFLASGPGLILPVPLHPSRLRERGFNQSFLLARQCVRAGTILGHGAGGWRVDPWIAERNVRTRSQAGLDREARQENVHGAFRIPDPSRVKGKPILLVDDVYTTGATARELGRELLMAGAGRIDLLVLAMA